MATMERLFLGKSWRSINCSGDTVAVQISGLGNSTKIGGRSLGEISPLSSDTRGPNGRISNESAHDLADRKYALPEMEDTRLNLVLYTGHLSVYDVKQPFINLL